MSGHHNENSIQHLCGRKLLTSNYTTIEVIKYLANKKIMVFNTDNVIQYLSHNFITIKTFEDFDFYLSRFDKKDATFLLLKYSDSAKYDDAIKLVHSQNKTIDYDILFASFCCATPVEAVKSIASKVSKDSRNRKLVMYCSYNDSKVCVKDMEMLLKLQTDVNCFNGEPIRYAIQMENVEHVLCLLEHKAKINPEHIDFSKLSLKMFTTIMNYLTNGNGSPVS